MLYKCPKYFLIFVSEEKALSDILINQLNYFKHTLN